VRTDEIEIILTDEDVPRSWSAGDHLAVGGQADANAAYRQMYRMVQDLHLVRREREVAYHDLENAHRRALLSLARAAEYKDDDTWTHIVRIGAASALLAEALGQPPEWCEMMRVAAPMHDVGKIGIPDHILKKPMALDDNERAIMNTHPEVGAKILGEGGVPLIRMAREIALTHHECWDGSGYPRGLRGIEIPLAGRIVSVIDFLDALTMDRCYRKALTDEDAIAMLRARRGVNFDPAIVDVALSISDELIRLRDEINARAPEEIQTWDGA
jgi:putative two-component system response regulator